MSNFVFLQAEWPALHDAATKAESLAYSDARTACYYAERSLGRIAHPNPPPRFARCEVHALDGSAA